MVSRSRRWGWWLLLGLCLHTASAFGQQAPALAPSPLDLKTLIADVRARNPSLHAARLEAQALGTRRRQVSALPEPTAGMVYQPVSVVTARGFQRTQWRVEQQFPFPGTLGLRGDVADLHATVASFEADAFEHDLVLRLKQTYYDLYRVQEHDRLIADFQEQLRDFEDVAATQYEVGTGMQQAVLKAQLERNALSIRRDKLAEQRRSALEAMARLLYRPDTTSLTGEVTVTLPALPADEEIFLQTALAQRPEVDALNAAQQRVERQTALARKAFWPDFAVSLTYFDIGHTDVPPSADGRDAVAISAGIKVPLWRSKLRATLEETQLKQRQVEAQMEALRTDIRTQVADLTHQLERQQHQLDLLQEALIPQAETTLESTLSAYTTGRTDFLNLLDAERMLFTLRLESIDTRTRLLKTAAALERTLGIDDLDELR